MVIGDVSAPLKSMSAASTKPTTGIAAPVCVLSLGTAIVEGLRFVVAVCGVNDDLLAGGCGLRVTLGLGLTTRLTSTLGVGLGLTTRLTSTLGVGLGFVLVSAWTSVLARFGAPCLDSALPSLLSEVAAMAAAPSALSAPNVAPASAASASVVSATALSTVVSSLATETAREETGETGTAFSKAVRRFASSSSARTTASPLKKSAASLSTLSRSTRSASLSTSVCFAAHLGKSSASLSTLSRSARSASFSTSFGFASHLDSATSTAMTLAAGLPPSDVERRNRSNNAIRGGATRDADR